MAALSVAGTAVGVLALGAYPAQASAAAVSAISTPTSAYKSATCTVLVGGIMDGRTFASINACGITFTFNHEVTKGSVRAGGSWTTWGSPPFTEGSKPGLIENFTSQLTITLSAGKRTVGTEIEGNAFAVNTFTTSFRHGSTNLGVVTRDVNGNAGARLFAVKTTAPTQTINKLVITGTDASGFALAKLRVG